VAQRATVSQARTQGEIRVDITCAVAVIGSLSLCVGEFALKELASASDGTERIVTDDAQGGSRRIHTAAPRTNLIQHRFAYPRSGSARRLGIVDHLRTCHGREQYREGKAEQDTEISHGPHIPHSFWGRSLFIASLQS